MVTLTKKSHIWIVLVVAGIFAVAAACLAMLGVYIYHTASNDTEQQDLNRASEYLQDQVRGCSNPEELRISTLDGEIPALVLPVRENGQDIEHWIFAEDGFLRSCSVEPGGDVTARNSQKIAPLRSIDLRIPTKNLLEISLWTDSSSAVSRIWSPGIGGSNE